MGRCEPMRALSVKQPWASLIISGRKTLEVRSWSTNYRGPIIVCASAAPDRARGMALLTGDECLGHAVGIVELVGVREGRSEDATRALVDPTGLLVWELACATPIKPVRVLGKLGLWRPDKCLVRAVTQSVV